MIDSEWGVSTSAACCLWNMALLLKNDIVDPVIMFAGERIQENNNPKDIYVGLMALGAIIVGPDSWFLAKQYL